MQLFARRAVAADVFGTGYGYDGTLGRTEASVKVNHDTALTDDGIFAAVSLIAGDIAGLPMRAFVTTGAGLTEPMADQPTWLEAPDPLDMAITDVAHKTQVALSILLAGNAYVLCEPNVFRAEKLTVLNPVRVQVRKPGQERIFQVMARASMFEDGWTSQDEVLDEFSSGQVLHIPYMLRPGRLTGIAPVDAQSGNIGSSIARRKWVETFFGKGGQIAGLVMLPQGAGEPEVELVEDRISKKWAGWRRAGRIGVLSGGATWVKTGLSPQDANLDVLARQHLEMAARIYGIPPFMIGSQEPAGVAYASSVERAQHYIDHCLARYTRPIEKAYSRLVPGDNRLRVSGSNTEVRFVFDALLRGDPKARWEMYGTALERKAITVGEVRGLENRPPLSDYSQKYLEGPDGLLQTPNNNPRQFPAGDQGPVPPGDTPDAPAPPTVAAPSGPPVGRALTDMEPIVIHNHMAEPAPIHVAAPTITFNTREDVITEADAAEAQRDADAAAGLLRRLHVVREKAA